jgi:hypothetical protein
METPKMYETENDLSLQRRPELNALMNQRRADDRASFQKWKDKL